MTTAVPRQEELLLQLTLDLQYCNGYLLRNPVGDINNKKTLAGHLVIMM